MNDFYQYFVNCNKESYIAYLNNNYQNFIRQYSNDIANAWHSIANSYNLNPQLCQNGISDICAINRIALFSNDLSLVGFKLKIKENVNLAPPTTSIEDDFRQIAQEYQLNAITAAIAIQKGKNITTHPHFDWQKEIENTTVKINQFTIWEATFLGYYIGLTYYKFHLEYQFTSKIKMVLSQCWLKGGLTM